MAGRLGATDSVNTIVIAHPAPLSDKEMRAIKVSGLSSAFSRGSDAWPSGPHFLVVGRRLIIIGVNPRCTSSFINQCRGHELQG